jgi:hypothetical protein
MYTVQVPHRTRKPQKRREASATPAVPAKRVREMLRQVAFVLHATRVVWRVGETITTK